MNKTYFFVTDQHLGEGNPKNHKEPRLDLFEDDEIYYKGINKILNSFGCNQIILCQSGDTFDFSSVLYKNKVGTDPTEEVAIYTIQKILDAHPLVIQAWQNWLISGGNIIFLIGNHDMQLFFINVQYLIRKRIMTRNIFSNKEIFNIEQRIRFEVSIKDNQMMCIHGNNANEIHKTPLEKDRFIKKHGLKQLLVPYLNLPFGCYLTELSYKMARGNWFAPPNKLLGKLDPHGYVYLKAVLKNWRFGISAALLWIFAPIKYKLSKRWWVRRSASFWTLIKYNIIAFLYTIRPHPHILYAQKILKENPEIKILFIGDEHTIKDVQDKHGRIIYPGNWSTIYEIKFPPIEIKWHKKLQWLEKIVKKIARAFKMFYGKETERFKPQKSNTYTFGFYSINENMASEAGILQYNIKENILKPYQP